MSSLAEAIRKLPQIHLSMRVLLAVVFIALSAQIEIPFYPVPVTGQSFAVLLVAAVFGMRDGSMVILSYVAAGILGLPVFSGGASGWPALTGASGGYLAGFVPAVILVGYLCQTGWQLSFLRLIAAMSIGTMVILFAGVLWLSRFVGWSSVLEYGVIPFLPGAMIKVFLSAGLTRILLPRPA
jgi:biotin transport system substrate-specific component